MTRSHDLAGWHVLVLRGGPWGERVVERVQERGGSAEVTPLLEIAPSAHPGELATATARWNTGDFDWLIVTSSNGVDALTRAGARPVPGRHVAAVGPATAAALERAGFSVDAVPDSDYSAAGLASVLTGGGVPTPASALLPLSDRADTVLEEALTRAGCHTERVTAYRTLIGAPEAELARRVAAGHFNAVLVTSGSAAEAIARHLTPPASTVLAAIGHPSAAALDRLGLRADVVADPHTITGLLNALAACGPAPTAPISQEDPQ